MRTIATMIKMFWWVLVIIGAIITVWIAVSYADVIIHNLTEGYEYPKWNFFVFFMR